MAINTRNCFWFGTEERADWFATPLAGADSSPSAWGADGTLLNGGGWALNSWGSHKRYTYEWPASSSRETAQRMKSYRDGTYGRGLLYFLEPTIFTTNVLPAHWADPSMSLDNEAPSLVYGVDPTPVATSGGANLGLPITSAQYDLSTVTPQTVPTPDSSVFIPIPTGHTLFLGAFYSSTGTGGVFATPVNGNGTLGTAVKLTEKDNSDTDVVTDGFSGDIRGVRLWVGRSDATASTVTIAAMAGRLMETSETVTYTSWVDQYRNLWRDPGFTSISSYGATGGATRTVSGGRITITSTASSAERAGITHNLSSVYPAGSYTFSVDVQSNSPNFTAARAYLYDTSVNAVRASLAIPAGSTESRVNVTGTATGPFDQVYLEFYGTAITPGNTGTFSRPILSPGTMVVPWFLPGTTPDTELTRYIFTGAVNASESVAQTRSEVGNPAKQNKLVSGPWTGGQGHSGCRFLGTPSYVTNSPIEGGRIGFAASFVEVGSWVYG